MNHKSIEHSNDTDMSGSLNAIRRAAKRARQVAALTGTALIVRHGEQIDWVIVTNQDGLSK